MRLFHIMRTTIYILFVISLFSCASDDSISQVGETTGSTIYFPPIDSNFWETKTINAAEWNDNELQPLLDYLEEKNSKGFIMLHNGKIVVEHYMNGHTDVSPWYWASAGKTLTSAVAGIAQNEGLIDINNPVSDYIGIGWTSLTLEKENLISCKNLLSMNSGLDDTLGDSVSPENLQYISDAGARWAYHNVYVKMQDVVAEASNQTWINFYNSVLRDPIGMTGSWISLGDLSVYWSTTRSMARFGLLISANGKWEDTQIISELYLNEATNTSQTINEAYGYLWWLNGKSTFHLPMTQLEFNGSLISTGPNDMYAALGKNDQKIYIVPSKNLVVVRMGEVASPEKPTFGLSGFDNELWEKINLVIN